MSYTMTQKRAALGAEVLRLLQTVDASYTVDERYRDAVLQARHPRHRAEIMGDPIRYALVTPAGMTYTQDAARTLGTGAPIDRTDTFRVQVWHEYADHATYASSSQADFDSILGDGLVGALADAPWLDSAGEMTSPAGGVVDLVALDSRGALRAHYLDFTIDIT